VPEGVTEEDLARLKRGFELYNEGNYDGLEGLISPDVVVERVGAQPPIKGWPAFRAFQEPDAFAWQRLDPLEWTVNGQKVLIRLHVRAKGAASGVELDITGWMVWTIRDGVGVHLLNTTDEREAREFLAEPARDPS
jgi:ketosteroid isomerase-like protein